MRGDTRMDIADRVLWKRSQLIDATEDEGGRYLDLAAFAEGRLDSDERERISEWLWSHPEAAGDIAAARALATADRPETLSETAVARAHAIIGDAGSSGWRSVVTFRQKAGRKPVFGTIAQWSGLAAALVVAGWLGFTLGVDASGMLPRNGMSLDDGIAQDLFGSSSAFFRDLNGGV